MKYVIPSIAKSNSLVDGLINLEVYFIRTGFRDEYPPTINRTAWFATVYREKLREARAEILANRYKKR